MTLDEFLELVDGVRPAGSGYVAVCPAHEDHEASLGISEGQEGVLLTCYAGCETQRVVETLGLTLADLFFTKRSKGHVDAEPETVYVYTDENGHELFQSLRYRTEKNGVSGKTFKQRHLGDEGEWVWGLEGVRRVLYRLPDLLKAVADGEPIFIVEGEKDVDNIRAQGAAATCNPMGAGKWRSEYVSFFAGHQGPIIIVADRDEPGRNHAQSVRASFLQASPIIEPLIFVVQARFGKDATDHLNGGGTLDRDRTTGFKELRQQRRGVVTTKALAEHALERLNMTPEDLPGYVLAPGVDGLGELVMRQGRLYAVGGYTGHGKTCLGLGGFRALSEAGKRAGYFSLEMPEMDLMNRLVAHRGIPLSYTENPWRLRNDPLMLHAYEQAVAEVGAWGSEIIFESRADADFIRRRTEDGEYEVIFVDHLHRFSMKDRNDLGEQMKALTNIALDMNVMVVVLCQLRKFERGKGQFVAYPRPTLQDFRETSMIGDDASMALAVWRQTDGSGISYTGQTEVIVLKNRHTTSKKDAAGHSWFPHFDDQRQVFVPAPVVTPPIEGGF